MLPRRLPFLTNLTSKHIRRTMSNPAESPSGPTAQSIRSKLTSTFSPVILQIHNDSHLHAHHAAMRGNTSPETHFRVEVVSDAFKGLMQPARHRMVYRALEEELRDVEKGGMGVHALGLVTRTPEEDERKKNKEAEKKQAASG